ncbi:hypothetical protein SAMN05660226_02281 [Parapedobacter luteus]|uniref:Uncharacterized protein n=1 Tax=Parapedobacter luteus TaxID=623280 RepID=A0A1T5CJU3_9SPHI|nr:hypothetical protein [Parapedobacter luteus]SKB59758.1 hypothetical protein SAMN05660226_02281 [Parapedobacter luteus]
MMLVLPSANAVLPGLTPYDLNKAIDRSHIDLDISPIDNFITNGIEINKLMTATPSAVQGNLIILGYVSAIESYFRALFRRLILVDDTCRNTCEKRQVTYGAVLSNKKNTLPEALFEDISFAGKKNLITSINNFLNLNIQESSLSPDLSSNLDSFSEICELRHCIVHRFGKFGSKNAISLGLDKHFHNVEKPIKCDFNTLQNIISVCHNTVRISNNFLFERILKRLILDGVKKKQNTIWSWNYSKDREKFNEYYETFYSRLAPPRPSYTRLKLYKNYKKVYFSL